MPPKGSITTAVTVTYDQFDQFFVAGNNKYTLPGRIDQLDIAMMAGYVALENLSLELTLPISLSRRDFSYLETDGFGQIIGLGSGPNGEVRDVNNNAGLGDTVLQARYLIYDELLSLGAKAALKIPGSYEANVINAPGDGQFDLGFGLMIAKRVAAPLSLYGGADLTFVGRFGKPANQLNLSLEAGIFPIKPLLLRVLYDKVIQFGGQEMAFFGLENDFPALDEDFDKVGGGIGFRVNPSLDLFATILATVAGKNTSESLGISVGVSKTF